MATSKQRMERVLEEYFLAWATRDSTKIVTLFTNDAWYKVKPFGLEEHYGKAAIKRYWEANPVSQVNPRPSLLHAAFAENICFAEWENIFTTHTGTKKTTRGMLVLEFADGLIKELREHYLSTEQA